MSRLYTVPFSSSLIDETAKIILDNTYDPDNISVVFPGKRPSLYLKAGLASASGERAFFPPRIFSFEEFIDHIARKKRSLFTDLEHTDAVWLLYSLVRSMPAFDHHPFKKKDFGDFFYWGKYLLDFIDRLDTEGIDNNILTDVEKNAAIGYDVPESVNELLANISMLRTGFHELLEKNGWFTRGTKHIAAVGQVREEIPGSPGTVLFAGIFGLNGTEKEIVRHFWDTGQTTVILEGSPEDWPILADLISYLGATAENTGHHETKKPEIHLHAGYDVHAEVLAAHSIIGQCAAGKTAVVLPSSEALFPLLNFVIDRIELDCNISMGYPVDRTAVFDLIHHILNARIRRRRDGRYPVPEYLAVMLHPFIKNLAHDSGLRGLLLHVERSLTGEDKQNSLAGSLLVTLGQIEDEAAKWDTSFGKKTPGDACKALIEVHRLCFRSFEDAETITEVAAHIEEALDAVLAGTPVGSYILSGTIFANLFESLRSLKTTLFNAIPFSSEPLENTRALCDFTLHCLSGSTIPFDTHPVERLEIIGMLESRSISFDRVIILDVNEGILPGPREINPLVPLGVFETLGIPPPEFTESIYRYNFYRLVHCAKEVHLIYRSADDRPRSRYIEEILWEEEKNRKELDVIPVKHTVLSVNLRHGGTPPVIEKTSAMITAIMNRGLSPSTIDAYVRCPLLYYFTRLIGLEERRSFSGDIEATDRGGIIHDILLETFRPFLGLPITKETGDELHASLARSLKAHFDEHPHSGEFYLFQRIASYKLDSFLKKHLNTLCGPVVITCLEESFTSKLSLDKSEVRLSGRIDRVDLDPSTGTYTVIDYKTGTSKQYPAKIVQRASFDDILSIHDHVTSFQLPIYMYVFSEQKGIPMDRMDAKLILLGSNIEELFFKKNDEAVKALLLNAYMKGLETVISHMLNPDHPFTAFDMDGCIDCPAKGLCHM